MKNYIKKLMLAAISAVVFTTSTHAVAPYAFGIKGGLSHNKPANILKATGLDGNDYREVFFNFGFKGSIYGEYAFHAMLGAGLEASFVYGRIFRLEGKDKPGQPAGKTNQDAKKDHVSASTAYMKLSPYLGIYPMGRDNKEDIGIVYVNVGPDFYIPVSLKPSIVQNGKEFTEANAEKAIKKDDLNKFGIGAGLAVGYEFPFGLTAELQGGYAFTDFFDKSDSNKNKGSIMSHKPSKDENSKLWNLGLSFGYNIATILENR